MRSDKDSLIEASLDLAWSHWSALGVRGMAQPPNTAVDPESLLYFTACLAEYDPRLRAEAGDWWSQYERHISRPRLNALASRFGEQVTSKLESLEQMARAPGHRGKSRLDQLNTPARSLLRLRCAFGANARAEVLLELLTRGARPDQGSTALALSRVGYSKRNVAFVLDDLVMAGILSVASEGNRARYRLSDPVGLERVLRPLPVRPGHWHFRLPVLAAFVELSGRLRGRDAVVQGIEARKTVQLMMPSIVAAGSAEPALSATAETYWPALQRWLVENIVADDADSDRRIPRMIEGVWVGPGQEPRRPERYSSAVLPRVSASPIDDRDLQCLDLVHVPTVQPANDSLWAVVSTAATTTYAHTIGLNNRERWHFVTWAFGGERTYTVEYAESLSHDRISRAYGKTAASRARADHPAVQLRLTRVDA